MGTPAITIDDIGKRYRIGRLRQHNRTFREALTDAVSRPLRLARGLGQPGRSSEDAHPILWALRNVSAEIPRGQVTGLIGRNGAGKSTLLKILSRITPPTEGTAKVRGTVGSLLEVGSGFHGDLTGRENTYLNGAILGMRKAEIDRKFDEIVAFAEIERFIDTPVKHYSSGMYLRLAFAVAAHLEPEILLVDEVLAVGDASFQKKCLGKMEQVGAEGRTVLFVSHNMPAVLRLCDRAILLEQGNVTAEGSAPEIVRRYLRSDAGTSAERVWTDPRTAPGDNCVRLKAVRVCRADGRVTETVDVREPVKIEIEYWNFDSRRRPSANIHVVNEDGIRLFVSADFNDVEWRDKARSPGLVKSTCCIPGSFLAEGQFFVTAGVHSFDISPTIAHVRERDLLAFRVMDQSDGDGARGRYGHIWPGVVRPLLNWTVQFTAMDITSNVS